MKELVLYKMVVIAQGVYIVLNEALIWLEMSAHVVGGSSYMARDVSTCCGRF